MCYAKELKEGFVEYTEQVVKLMVPLLKFYFHDDILHYRVIVFFNADVWSAGQGYYNLVSCNQTDGWRSGIDGSILTDMSNNQSLFCSASCYQTFHISHTFEKPAFS